METAHKNNIIHRDIKPHNIIITEDGIAKVTDFGIAKSVSNSTITAFGTTLGSVHYFSPEHARGGYTDAKSDLYSLGVVIYEMITGRVPFDADTPVSVALKHMQEIPKEPITLNPAIPMALNNIVMKAMKKDPALRYNSATEMLRDLTLVLKNPDGEFVKISRSDETFPTQVVPTVGKKNIEEKIKERDKNKKQNFFQKHKTLTIILVLIILFAVSLGGTILVFNLTRSKDIQIPNLVGLSIDQVKEKIKGTKLTYEVTEEKYDVDIDAGLVISQVPEYKADYKIKENEHIKIVVSLGQKIVKVPKVVGKTEEEAKKALGEQDLEVVVVEEFDKKVEKGYVIKQDVDPEQEVAAGQTVTITVSKGIEEVTVPNVIGKPKDDAVKELTDAGFTISATLTEEDHTKEDGVILKQSLDAGTTVEKGANITITVNEIQQLINATVQVNLKSILNNTSTGNNTLSSARTAKVRIVVDEDTVYERTHTEDETNIKATFAGKGTVTVKLYVDDILKSTKQTNLNKETTILFE